MTSWHNLMSLCTQRTKNFHKCPHIEPQSPASFQPAPSVSPLSSTVTTASSHSTLLFYSAFSCTSSVFKVQTTKAGCLSPQAVIDRLTKRERKKETGERRRGGGVSRGRQRRRLESSSEPEGLFLSVLMRRYWAEDTQDTRDEMTNG